jgi:UDP-N-acetylglucosamine 2-epimerase (non-hydrolysing)
MKIAPITKALDRAKEKGSKLSYRLIHTGQHYDKNMSGSFFEQLGIPEPQVNLGAGGGTQAEQTAKIMVGYEALLLKEPCDLCLVVGDVTSTMACSIAAKKLHIKVAHVEAGIRSGDLTMPEEINRMVTDAITDLFFTTTPQAGDNLLKAGIDEKQIFFVGNTMIDTLLSNRGRFSKPELWDEFELEEGKYLVMTLHRPANVDEEQKLKALIDAIMGNVQDLPVVFPVHPRTKAILDQIGVSHPQLKMVSPLGYLQFNYLVERAKAVITDSGGITEETTVFGVPCITLRENTERPETISIGTNELIGVDPSNVPPALSKLFAGNWKKGAIPEKWDGNTAERIVSILEQSFL